MKLPTTTISFVGLSMLLSTCLASPSPESPDPLASRAGSFPWVITTTDTIPGGECGPNTAISGRGSGDTVSNTGCHNFGPKNGHFSVNPDTGKGEGAVALYFTKDCAGQPAQVTDYVFCRPIVDQATSKRFLSYKFSGGGLPNPTVNPASRQT